MTEPNAAQALIGCILAGYPDPGELFDLVRPDDFDQPFDEWIWTAAHALVLKGQRPDPVTVKDALGANANKLPGGPLYLSDVHQRAPHVHQAPLYARQVRDAAARRRVANAAIKISQMTQSDLPIDELIDQARLTLDQAAEMGVSHNVVEISDIIPAVIDIAQNGQPMGVATGWPGIDRIIHGLQPGRLIVVGARPGIGKSLMGTNLAHRVAAVHGLPALICSMEMPRVEVGQRILAHHASVNLTHLAAGTVSERAWMDLDTATNEVLGLPIVIEDDASQTIMSIRTALTKTRRKHGDVPLVVVDYLQLMKPRDQRVSRAEQIGEISRGLKNIAREFDTCVVAMAQVNRESTKRGDGKPTMADLRESGSIEADADIVILLHRPDTESTRVEVLIEKNRSGSRGATNLELYGHFARLAEPAWSAVA